ncbi:YkgJ family cysteine cluster protein [Paraburkholderia lacunae]|uniref:Zinc/iron-chelating domain-containing protein n=1 Tax=Paraburkholderia lacunae TaxID=2211104 RepID=A0A370N8Z6_9BURK|nr:YkgJ family cysteine cluster protein [Paraburkholderia lacunae]RDK02071.1 zinc/iron-chelating domain-containing protein [Paraburkholderia lacunae]
MNIDFGCTMCGKCCHDLRLPLTVAEAITWLKRGHQVQLFLEAIPWPEEPAHDNLIATHKRRRSFPALSGSLPIRVVAVIVAAFDGPCPNLGEDMQCSAYESRPLVCRVYPAEINPFIPLSPDQKACPPEAWMHGTSPLLRQGQIVDAQIAALIAESRNTDAAEVDVKAALCETLGIATAALGNEGFVVHSPDASALLSALESARATVAPMRSASWRFVSNRSATVDALRSVDAVASETSAWETESAEFLGFFADDLMGSAGHVSLPN